MLELSPKGIFSIARKPWVNNFVAWENAHLATFKTFVFWRIGDLRGAAKTITQWTSFRSRKFVL